MACVSFLNVNKCLYSSGEQHLFNNFLPCFFPLIPSGFFSADHPSEAGIWQVWAPLQDPKEESQQVPILPLPEVPVGGHVPQWWVLRGVGGGGAGQVCSASSPTAYTLAHVWFLLLVSTHSWTLSTTVVQMPRKFERVRKHIVRTNRQSNTTVGCQVAC